MLTMSRIPFLLAACIITLTYSSVSSEVNGLHRLNQLVTRESHLDVPHKCGLPALSAALQQQSKLDAGTRAALENALSRPSTQASKLIGSFRIHYDTSGFHAAAMLDELKNRIPNSASAYVDSIGQILQYSLRLLRDSLGYLAPPPDNGLGGGPEYDIYLQNLGGSSYGYTTPETPLDSKPEGGTYTSFIVIDSDFDFVIPLINRGLPALRVTVAHELYHAVQLGNYGYWGQDIYFYEMTAVWMEDVAYDEVNDYHQYVKSPTGHFARPEAAFTANDLIMYSRAVWPQYLAKRFGRDVVRLVWEEIRNGRPLSAMDAALQNPRYASTLRNAFVEWSIWNYFTADRSDSVAYYPEGRSYPRITEMAVEFMPPSRTIGGTVHAFGARYFDISSSGTQRIKILALNLNVAAAQQDNGRMLNFALYLNTKKLDSDYISTGGQLFAKLDVPDPTNWYMKDIFGVSGVDVPFPNPFVVDGRRHISFPLANGDPVAGTMSIFTSSMDLVRSEGVTSHFMPQLGKHVFRWNGENEVSQLVGSGIYFYVITTKDRTYKGKFAVIRK